MNLFQITTFLIIWALWHFSFYCLLHWSR